MLLITFDLPRDTAEDRKQANEFRKRLVRLGFTMKQYSLYEREVRNYTTKNQIIEILIKELPDQGEIILYQLPDEVNNSQITILGNGVIKKAESGPKLIVL